MLPFGLPSTGYAASARWHVFRFQVSASQRLCVTPRNGAPLLKFRASQRSAPTLGGTMGESKARQRHGPWERTRPRVHQHAPPRAELKKMRPQAGGIFDMSGARRTRRHPRQACSPGPFDASSVSFPRQRHKRSFHPLAQRRGIAAPAPCLIRLFPVDFALLHPSGCLWQSTQSAPAGMCSGLRFPPSPRHPAALRKIGRLHTALLKNRMGNSWKNSSNGIPPLPIKKVKGQRGQELIIDIISVLVTLFANSFGLFRPV